MNYAAAVGDDNPRYFDDEHPDGIVAPPLFGVAATWPAGEHLADCLGAEGFAPDALLRAVHYTEHLVFHRPIRPGQRLTISGRIAAVGPHRAGSLVVVRYDAVDQESRPVLTEHTGALLRDVEYEGGARADEDLPQIPMIRSRRFLWESLAPVSRLAPFLYDGCTGIVFPIHTSKAAARRAGLPSIILQGSASLAICARELVNREADGDPLALRVLACRFAHMVIPETTLRISLAGRERDDLGSSLFFSATDSTGKLVVSDGYARISPPTAAAGDTR